MEWLSTVPKGSKWKNEYCSHEWLVVTYKVRVRNLYLQNSKHKVKYISKWEENIELHSIHVFTRNTYQQSEERIGNQPRGRKFVHTDHRHKTSSRSLHVKCWFMRQYSLYCSSSSSTSSSPYSSPSSSWSSSAASSASLLLVQSAHAQTSVQKTEHLRHKHFQWHMSCFWKNTAHCKRCKKWCNWRNQPAHRTEAMELA